MSSSMSTISRQAARSLQLQSRQGLRIIIAGPSRPASTSAPISDYYDPSPYSRPSTRTHTKERPPRPDNSTFFTGSPTYHSEVSNLRSTLKLVEKALREDHVFPLPRALELPDPPNVAWDNPIQMAVKMSSTRSIGNGQHRDMIKLLKRSE